MMVLQLIPCELSSTFCSYYRYSKYPPKWRACIGI
nr:MAG TPA: hypothetical protein [Myoviridae sp. ctNPX13]